MWKCICLHLSLTLFDLIVPATKQVQNNELHNPSFQSVLKKKGEVVKKWQRRLFLLKDGKLFYFKPQGNNFVATPSLCQGGEK